MKYELLGYKKCSTCKGVEKILKDKGYEYSFRDITENKLSINELKQMHKLSGLALKKFFNTSGLLYREMELSKKLAAMEEDKQFELLASDGKLVKRPILLTDEKIYVGAEVKKYLEE
jgi:transcriptional regulator, spx/mgsR family